MAPLPGQNNEDNVELETVKILLLDCRELLAARMYVEASRNLDDAIMAIITLTNGHQDAGRGGP